MLSRVCTVTTVPILAIATRRLMSTKNDIVGLIDSARGELEQALQHLQKIPALDWGAVRYVLHAMGNYLNINTACIHLLGVALEGHPDPDVAGYLHSLERITDLMTHLTRHLSHASASREVPLVREPVDLSRMVRNGCTFYQSVSDIKRIEIVCGIADAVPPVVGDRIAVATVLDNLLSNAVKYSPPGKRVWVWVKSEQDYVVCEVRDEGPGLSAEDQARLFREGERLGPRPTGGEPSTGYGLAISRDLIARMGGRIWCESKPGQGAVFAFQLPVYIEPASEQDKEVKRSP
jgi:signal transduction histidine kinase